jgi:Raf kinase inhibitor-like YbhB/YbcL family protein
MPDRRGVLRATLAAAVPGLVAGCSSGGSDGGATTTGPTTVSPVEGFRLSSPAFEGGDAIPVPYTADGEDLSPPLEITGVPEAASTLALVVDDPDAPPEVFVHWALWDLPADTTSLPEGINQSRRVPDLGDAKQGTNGFGELGYRGPRPPEDDGPHTYRFTCYAVDGSPNVQAGANYGALARGLDGTVLSSTRLTATYDR